MLIIENVPPTKWLAIYCFNFSPSKAFSFHIFYTQRHTFLSRLSPLFTYSNCDGVILPRVAKKLNGKEQEFCPRCECKYENRNTAIIKVVVIIVIWVISLLVVYMLFLIILDPLLNKRIKNNYQEHTNEDVRSNE